MGNDAFALIKYLTTLACIYFHLLYSQLPTNDDVVSDVAPRYSIPSRLRTMRVKVPPLGPFDLSIDARQRGCKPPNAVLYK